MSPQGPHGSFYGRAALCCSALLGLLLIADAFGIMNAVIARLAP